MKILLPIPLILYFRANCLAQEAIQNSFSEKIQLEISFLPIPNNIYETIPGYTDLITGFDIYIKHSDRFSSGISTYGLIFTTVPFKFSSSYFISGLFTRYYLEKRSVLFVDTGFGVGNICQCPQLPNSFAGFHRLSADSLGFYLNLNVGVDLNIFNKIKIKPMVKFFYMLNQIESNRIHFRPNLSFVISRKKIKPAIIHNPRF